MKTFYLLIAMLTTNVSPSQMVDFAFYSQSPTEGTFEFNSSKPELSPSKTSVSSVKIESENMSIHEFKNFGLYKTLLEILKDEMLVVHSYKLVKERSRLDPEVYQVNNGLIDTKSIELVQGVKDGDKYILYDILVKNTSGKIFRIPLMVIARIKVNAL